jgi:hypothetical protein
VTLTAAQLDLLATDIAADPTLGSLPHNADSATAVCAAYNQPDVPAFWVWRTSLYEQEIYEATTTPEGTAWNWATYKAQSVQDRDSWARMMAPGVVNPSLAQTRAGWVTIFGGSGASGVQVTFLQTLGRRQATRAEALFATGAGTTAAPALLTFEGMLTESEVEQAWAQ